MKVQLVGGGRLIDATHSYSAEREAMVINGTIEAPLPDPERLQYFDIYLDGHFFYRTPTDVTKWPAADLYGKVRLEFTIELKGKSARDGRMGL